MGNRDALLQAAQACLLEKGYAQTTARDIAQAARVSLAAIGYHFGSKEALLTQAVMRALQDWRRELGTMLAGLPPGDRPAARFEAIWERLLESFARHRPLWRANYEMFAQINEHPEIREVLGGSVQNVRRMLAALFIGIPEGKISDATANTVGALHHLLLSGMLAHWLVDAAATPDARALRQSLCVLGLSLNGAPAAGVRPRRVAPAPRKRR